MDILLWLTRYGHVLSAACWVGGYALLAFVLIPSIRSETSSTFLQMTITCVRVLTYAGVLTIGFGLVLIMKTRGFTNLIGSLWGACILLGIVIAVSLLGIGDGALRPALRSSTATTLARARTWALLGFFLTVAAVGAMTAAMYVR